MNRSRSDNNSSCTRSTSREVQPTLRTRFGVSARVVWFIVAIIVLQATLPATTMVPSAHAQTADRLTGSENTSSIPQIDLVFGFNGVYGDGRFVPVTILLTGGVEPFSGTVTLRYRQGGAQSIASVAAVAATPGRTVEVPLLLSPPTRLDALEVELHNHLGRRVRTLNYRQSPSMSASDLPLPSAFSGATTVFVIVGDSPAIMSLNRALQRWPEQFQIRRTTVNVAPNSLPLHDAAYEGVHLLIVDEQAGRQIEPARAAAIRQWVASGGRVLVLTGRSGSAWRTFLPGPAADAIELGETVAVAGPSDLEAELEELAARRVVSEQPNAPPARWPPDADADAVASENPAQELRVRPAATVMARPVRLLDVGESMGWKTRWMTSDSADVQSRSAGLLAEGPAGLGWAVVLGIEPRFLPDPVNSQSELLVLRAAISNILADFDRLPIEQRTHHYFAGPIPMSVDAMTLTSAQAHGFQILLDGIESPTGVILFVGIAMVLLALLVGPVDFLVLRRIGLSHRSWLTSLGWITIASLIAYVLPNVTDRGTTRLAQLHTVDVIAAPGDGTHAPVPPIAWRTSLVGLYSATRDLLSIVDSAEVAARTRETGGKESAPAGRIAPPGGVWRGVAPTQTYWFDSQPTGVRLPMVQSTPPQQAMIRDIDWRGLAPGNAAATGGQSLQPMSVGPWTLRTFEGHRRDQPIIRASAQFSGSTTTSRPTLRVVLEGLPPGAAIEHSSCSVGGRYVALSSLQHVDETGQVVLQSMPIEAATLRPDRVDIIGSIEHGSMYAGGNWRNFSIDRTPEYLAGSERRTLAFEHLALTGRWIVVRCTLASNDEGSLTLVRRNGEILPHEVIEHTVYRIAVPLDDASASVVERLLAGAPDLPWTRTTGTSR